MKNILCMYSNLNDADHFQTLKQYFKEHTYEYTSNLEEAITFYNQNSYDLLIIDFTTSDGKAFLEHASARNKEQKIITMSKNLECSIEKGCGYCFEYFNRRRILHPINIKELMNTIIHFDDIVCTYKNQFKNILNILDKIILNYQCFIYDKLNQIITPKEDYCTNTLTHELIEITKLLTAKNINFSVDESFNIKLSPSL